MSEWEDQIGEYAQTLITHVEAGEPAEFLTGLTVAEVQAVAVAVAVALVAQETANDHLFQRNAVLEGSNVALFRERRELRERVSELRSILDARTAASTAKQQRKEAA